MIKKTYYIRIKLSDSQIGFDRAKANGYHVYMDGDEHMYIEHSYPSIEVLCKELENMYGTIVSIELADKPDEDMSLVGLVHSLSQGIVRWAAGMGIGCVTGPIGSVDKAMGTDYYRQLEEAARKSVLG